MKQSTNSKYSEAQNTSCAKGQMIKTNQAHMLNYKLQNGSSVSVNISDSVHNNTVTNDDIVGHDSQGWPLYQLRVISLLRAIGMSDDIIDQIPKDILTSTITTLEDDGSKQSQSSMGYGVNEECIVNCAIDKNKNIVYLWSIPKARKEDKHD